MLKARCRSALQLEELGPGEGGAPAGESLPVPIRLPRLLSFSVIQAVAIAYALLALWAAR
ncbi:hypothetical protein AB3662_26800 [Sorangium cellulosum]|uniref:hypothetical protein n=1 Tax=Sorangium cellulosum TaxID=56 RepID=UPI003D9A1C10